MYKIKQLPEDFIVEEQSNMRMESKGSYCYFLLKKRNYSSEEAIHAIANYLRIPRKNFSYAGNKDKRALTTQLCSVLGRIRELKLQDIELTVLGYGDNPILLGDLVGNKFTIIVRNITKKPKTIKKIINYFGEQRFSKNNPEIGKAIVKKEFKKAVELIAQNSGAFESKLKEHLEKKPTEYVNAIRKLPKSVIKLYIHSYQSKLWNETAKHFEKNKNNIKIPIIGFATEISNNKIRKLINNILKKENLTLRDFIIKQLPEFSSEGGERDLFIKIKNLEIGKLERDELNKEMKKIIIKFELPKGSYATEVVKAMLS